MGHYAVRDGIARRWRSSATDTSGCPDTVRRRRHAIKDAVEAAINIERPTRTIDDLT